MSYLDQGAVAPSGCATAPTAAGSGDSVSPPGDEMAQLQAENAALQAKIEELGQLLIKAKQETDDSSTELQREYESLIEEKSEMIRTLHLKNAELRGVAAGQSMVGDQADSQLPEHPALQLLQADLEQQRRQIADDEEGMMAQLRQMEMALAKDRAELARQRAELQRLHHDLKHELDVASRDGGLRERLGALQRSVSNVGATRPSVNQATPPPTPLPKVATGPASSQSKSGLFRRIFGAQQ